MRKFFRFLTVGLTAAIFCLSISGCSTDYTDDSKQVMKKLDIVASLSENGDMTVRETWSVDLQNRGRDYSNLYRTFPVDQEKVDGVDQVSVYDEDRKVQYAFAGDVDPEEVQSGSMDNTCYLHQTSDITEVGWFMPPIEEGVRTFTVSYRVKNIVQVYRDTAVLYNFFQKDFNLPVEDLQVQIDFPQGGKEDGVQAWLHTTAQSNLTIDSASRVSFTASRIPVGTSVEVRLCMPPQLFSASNKTSQENVLSQIRQEEQKWADDYQAALWRRYILGIVDAAGAVLSVLAAFVFFVLIRKKYRRHIVESPGYTREIPEGSSPAGIANLFYFYNSGGIGKKEENRMFSATLLNLARKGYLSFQNYDKDFLVSVTGDTRHMLLTESEEAFYQMVSTAAEEYGHAFTMHQFKKYAEKHCKYVNRSLEDFLSASKREIADRGYYETRPMFLTVAKSVGILLLFAALVLFMGTLSLGSVMVYLPLAFVISGILLIIAGSARQRLSIRGEEDYALWHGLKQFMLEFSRMKEYGVPQLELWEEYLVYATMMGISKDVCKQLKLVYPQLSDESYVNTYFGRSYLYYLFGPRMYMGGFRNSAGGFNFGETLGNTLGDINAAAVRLANPPPSSGGGGFGGGGFGGGGFSGGGGGFGGGGGGVR